ncbi:MAG TPA: signal peptide peptidase SppA [Gammaproteobacteria bacterium]
MSNGFLFGRVLGTAWAVVDGFRKLLHLFLLLLILLVLAAGFARRAPPVPEAAALVISPEGVLVDQLSGDPFERALARARGLPLEETLLKDLIDAVRAAKDDERIKALVLELDGLAEAGLSKLQELAEEIEEFKTSGKPVFAIGDGFDRDQYYLAAHADEIFMHPMGFVLIDGYSRFLPYYKEALDKLYIDYNVWTVGEYKSFVEPITRNSMSEQDKEATAAFLNDLWSAYQQDVVAARGLAPDALQRYADDAVTLLRGAGGNTARLAVDYGLVDELLHRDEMRARIREAIGVDEEGDASDFPSVNQDAYLQAVRRDAPPAPGRSRVAVVVLSGMILDGTQPPGTVGGDSTAQLIREAGEDEDVKALVLRVDSPGGSAFASDVILRQVEVFQESGRPVVVSMGSVAASGGYWVSMSADEIWASPTTLTGSIGVGATLPTFQNTLDRVGVNVDGIGTTELSGQYDLLRGLGENVKQLIGETVRETYEQFVTKVSMYRGRPVEEIDRVARGRVWTGSDAYDRGLVDKLGDLDDAIASAAELAGLEEGRYDVEYYEPRIGLAERFALGLVETGAPVIEALDLTLWPRPVQKLIERAEAPLEFLSTLNDPRSLYAYCFCDVR